MAAVLKIGGTVVNRVTSRIVLHTLTLSIDSPETLEFTQLVEPACCGDFSAGQSISLTDTGYTFLGTIVRAQPINIGTGSIAIGYLAMGLRWQANLIWITDADGTGSMVWNEPPTPGYVPSASGQSVGDILKNILDQHMTQLNAIGITGYSALDLTPLSVVPPEPVTASGRLWDALCDVLAQWSPNHAIWADGTGFIHVKDTSTLPATTLTLDVDPITLESITKDHAECFTQVCLRGAANQQGAYLSLREGTLAWDQLPADVAAFTISNFFSPKGASDAGPINSMTSTSVVVHSDSTSQVWAVNALSAMGAYLWAFNPLATGITFSEQVTVTANTSMSAGGSMTITVSPPFSNSGYTRFQLRGNRSVQSLTWRKLKIVPTWVAQHLMARFQHSFPWSPVDGVAVQTMTPVGNVCWSSSHSPPFNEFPWPFEIVPYDGVTNGYLILNEPAPKAYSSQTTLQTPGASVGPDDLKVLIPYSLGALSVTAPGVGSFNGTAFTVDGVQRTLYRDYPQWLDSRNNADMATLAGEILKTVHDTVYEGSCTYHGKAVGWLTLGKSLNIARFGGTTGWEAINAAVRSVTLQWPQSGASMLTGLNFSSRRRQFSGDRLYLHPAFGTSAQLGGLEGHGFNPFGLTTAGMAQITRARQQQFEDEYLSPAGAYEGFDTEGQFKDAEKNRYKRKETESDRMRHEQHKRRQDDEREKAEKERWEGGDVIAVGPKTQKEEREERRRWEGGAEEIGRDPAAEQKKAHERQANRRKLEREEHLSEGSAARGAEEFEEATQRTAGNVAKGGPELPEDVFGS